MKWIYKITYPNGKIYIGKDLTGSLSYFGSANSNYIMADFEFTDIISMEINRDLLWWSNEASDTDVNKKEVEFILKFCSNNPKVGYNQWPKFKEETA